MRLKVIEATEVVEASDVIMSVEVIEATESFKSNLTCIFLPARARYIMSNPDETPCNIKNPIMFTVYHKFVIHFSMESM